MNKLVLKGKRQQQTYTPDDILEMDSATGFELVTIENYGNSGMECTIGSVNVKWSGGNFNPSKKIVSANGIRNYFFQVQLTFTEPLNDNTKHMDINRKVAMSYASFSGASYVDDELYIGIGADIRDYSILYTIEIGGETQKHKKINKQKFVFKDLLYEMVKEFDSETLAYFFNKRKKREVTNNPMKIVTI